MTETVGLFVTCLINLFRPSVGFAAVRLIEEAGFAVSVPSQQTCCGQPAYNSGDRQTATRIARGVIAAFENFDYVVAPSGSCASILIAHYPELLADEPVWADRARVLAGKTHELMVFLCDVARWRPGDQSAPAGTLTYHDACSGLRELSIRDQPRTLLAAIADLQVVETDMSEICCGFGGAFCVKYPVVAEAMADAKIRAIEAVGADHLVAGDLGCLLHLAGRLARKGSSIQVRHAAEILAGMADSPAIGAPARGR